MLQVHIFHHYSYTVVGTGYTEQHHRSRVLSSKTRKSVHHKLSPPPPGLAVHPLTRNPPKPPLSRSPLDGAGPLPFQHLRWPCLRISIIHHSAPSSATPPATNRPRTNLRPCAAPSRRASRILELNLHWLAGRCLHRPRSSASPWRRSPLSPSLPASLLPHRSDRDSARA